MSWDDNWNGITAWGDAAENWRGGGGQRGPGRRAPDDFAPGYYSQYESDYGPMHGRGEPRRHQQDLTIPPAYGHVYRDRRPTLINDQFDMPVPSYMQPELRPRPFREPEPFREREPYPVFREPIPYQGFREPVPRPGFPYPEFREHPEEFGEQEIYPMEDRQLPPWQGRPDHTRFADFSQTITQPLAMEMTYNVQSTEADVHWKVPPALAHGSLSYDFSVNIEGGQSKQTLRLPQWRSTLRMKLNAGSWYSVEVEASTNNKVLSRGLVKFKAVFNMDEMKDLYMKAVKYCGVDMHRFDIFYRNKPKEYWDKIEYERNGIMEKYEKDANGQPGSPINAAFDGLFFSANLQNGRLPLVSPFGPIRMVISADTLVNFNTNLYFADFYCNYSAHYVTVVATVPGSATDEYCRRTLIPLPLSNNPFLRVFRRTDQVEHWVNDNIWIETFYTEDVPLSFGRFDRVQATGKSTPGGLPNNKYCTLCNLHPLPAPPGVDPSKLTTSSRKRKLSGSREENREDYRGPVNNDLVLKLDYDYEDMGRIKEDEAELLKLVRIFKDREQRVLQRDRRVRKRSQERSPHRGRHRVSRSPRRTSRSPRRRKSRSLPYKRSRSRSPLERKDRSTNKKSRDHKKERRSSTKQSHNASKAKKGLDGVSSKSSKTQSLVETITLDDDDGDGGTQKLSTSMTSNVLSEGAAAKSSEVANSKSPINGDPENTWNLNLQLPESPQSGAANPEDSDKDSNFDDQQGSIHSEDYATGSEESRASTIDLEIHSNTPDSHSGQNSPEFDNDHSWCTGRKCHCCKQCAGTVKLFPGVEPESNESHNEPCCIKKTP